MSAFCSPLIMEDDFGEGGHFTLHEPLIYQSDLLKKTLTVPALFETDLASIPRGLWNILPPIGKYDRAAVLHDHLYKYNGVTRSEADGVLKEAMEVCRVSGWQRWMIYAGVRVGGGGIWARYRAAEQERERA